MVILKNTTLDTHGWQLESAVERHQTNPKTFPIPPAHIRQSLEFGDRVKLLFLFITFDAQYPHGIVGCERMWVTIIDVTGEEYTGLLESSPRISDALRSGDVLAFQSHHICDIMPRPGAVQFKEFQRLLRDQIANRGE